MAGRPHEDWAVRRYVSLLPSHVNVVALEKGHDVGRGLAAVDRATVPVLVEVWKEAAVVQGSVSDNNGVEVCNVKLLHICTKGH